MSKLHRYLQNYAKKEASKMSITTKMQNTKKDSLRTFQWFSQYFRWVILQIHAD